MVPGVGPVMDILGTGSWPSCLVGMGRWLGLDLVQCIYCSSNVLIHQCQKP
jgi:hypothetical protein